MMRRGCEINGFSRKQFIRACGVGQFLPVFMSFALPYKCRRYNKVVYSSIFFSIMLNLKLKKANILEGEQHTED